MIFSATLIATPIVGCGGVGSDYDWRVKLFDGADDDFIESVGRLGAIMRRIRLLRYRTYRDGIL